MLTVRSNISCPQFHDIMQQISLEKQTASPATICLFFYDYMVNDCDASTLVSSTAFNRAERDDVEINLSLAEMSAFNDVMTPEKFDYMYYQNLQRGLGLLASNHEMAVDERTKPFVDLYSANQTEFFRDFAHAMEKSPYIGRERTHSFICKSMHGDDDDGGGEILIGDSLVL
ncbi:hypothetical protein HS088_TW06G00951 [Tripterygium wilfordii]|uniref:peroxidase n=1 Tax=Tripterygium wilfordii TaxID=458696 RepID=A0A7J7DL19_TRIWF|nr:hypothetical protein HS088_TW06G00951 [Tripterygium wilfordii]